MKILLTGSSGFVGSHFCGDENIKRIVVRDGTHCKHWGCDKYNVDTINGQTDWSSAFEDIDVVIHLAALAHSRTYTSDDYKQVNIDGALHLAKQAASVGVKRFVFVSSIGVHGSATFGTPVTTKSPLVPDNDYTRSKLAAELGLKKLSLETGLEVVIVRPTLVYGANAPGNFGALTKLVGKLRILPFGLATNQRDFVAVQNLVDLLKLCTIHPNATGHTFLASDLETVSIKKFTNAIGEGLDKKIVQLPVPVSLMKFIGKIIGKSEMIEQLYGDLQVDSSNIEDVLGWTPPLTMKKAMASLRNSSK
ncbi:UDP-glucose 4-epimerase [Vibrio breoganii]|uniref:NAD-dependent epimerase/dehydratase family protein n=1 Tax=Vibrio breoganii TaxID=553239 RepID=A0AAP8MU49_9VIBR|nr:NAD-dependent epimerase/dehydratase family protein [Vibrio breoganii]NMO74131.1 NAD-dependent epimerase/dehydratase family protein [Vibrio breoganii]NMR70876.1 NAD-dependent epimerase/dehydratase family protein [Vibrio breoganii]PMG02931.1 UDP-glucose 4-epimerase [Vibrio breoganii]PML88198.1 UDP-glucose 4-epimerase [Vibrio breoganii]PMP05681.1 UDP-glucose 4-epimerase [Vibrio breoganii]